MLRTRPGAPGILCCGGAACPRQGGARARWGGAWAERRVLGAGGGVGGWRLALLGPACEGVSSCMQQPHCLPSTMVSQQSACPADLSLLKPSVLQQVASAAPVCLVADPGTQPQTGLVLSVAPLMGAAPAVDARHPRWLHVQVGPGRSRELVPLAHVHLHLLLHERPSGLALLGTHHAYALLSPGPPPAPRCGRPCGACSRCWLPPTPATRCSTCRSTSSGGRLGGGGVGSQHGWSHERGCPVGGWAQPSCCGGMPASMHLLRLRTHQPAAPRLPSLQRALGAVVPRRRQGCFSGAARGRVGAQDAGSVLPAAVAPAACQRGPSEQQRQ